MKKFILPTFILCIMICNSFAQSFYQRINYPGFGGVTNDCRIATTQDSNFVILGTVGNPLLTKIPLNGNAPQSFRTTGIGTAGRLHACSDNGFFIHTWWPGRMIVKTDSLFQMQWGKFSSTKLSLEDVYENQGNYYVIGSSRIDSISSYNYGTTTISLLKFDNAGNLLAHQIVADTTSLIFSRNRFLYNKGITGDANGNIYICFHSRNVQLGGTCNELPIILKFDSGLNLIWANCYLTNQLNRKTDLITLHDGSILFAGDYYSSGQFCRDSKIYLKKIDPSGTVIFAKVYSHSFRSDENYYTATEAEDHSLIVSGSFYDSLRSRYSDYLFRTDSVGNLISSKVISIPTDPLGQAHELQLSTPIGNRIPLTVGNYTNHHDTLYFMQTDTTLNAPCGTGLNQLVDSSVSILYADWLAEIALLQYNFQLVSTSITSQTQQVVLSDICPPLNNPGIENDVFMDLYPNPASSQVSISASVMIDEIEITNAMGQLITRLFPSEMKITLDLNLLNGIYFVILSCDGKRSVKKMIVNSNQ